MSLLARIRRYLAADVVPVVAVLTAAVLTVGTALIGGAS